jgi:hypothetical protein
MGLKIGVDLHGVIDTNPELFKALAQGLIQTGNEIYIVSGPPMAHVEYELYQLGIEEDIHWTDLSTIVDYLHSTNTKIWQNEKGQWWASDEDWWSAKSKIAAMFDLDIMIDNMARYQPYFKGMKTRFILI